MAERYKPPFDLDAIAERIGYPLFMKPFDGGTWTAVTRIASSGELHRSYEESGERLMHLQAAVEPYDVFTRSLSIRPADEDHALRRHAGASRSVHTRSRLPLPGARARGDNDQPPRQRLLSLGLQLLRDDRQGWAGIPDRLRQRIAGSRVDEPQLPLPVGDQVADLLVCVLHGHRTPDIDQSEHPRLFDVGDREELAYEEKLERYRELADAHLQAAAFEDFRTTALPHLDEAMVEYIESAEFDELLVRIIRAEEQPEMQESLIERSRSLVGAWAAEEHAAAR